MQLTPDDFLRSMDQIRKLGPMRSVMKLIPGMRRYLEATESDDLMDPENDMRRMRAMIESMTLEKRWNPEPIDDSRRSRIARGSGTHPADVQDLQKQFTRMRGLMQEMMSKSKVDQMRAIRWMHKDMLDPPDDL